MKREVLLDSLLGQRRLAVIEDGVLCELYRERESARSLTGNIYVGHVQNVLPGMNAAFVDIGLEKNAFLYAGDIRLDLKSNRELSGDLEKQNIRALAKPGQDLLVQVVKEPGGNKGPRVSGHITLPGRLLVLLPTMRYIGVSRKIEDEAERARLREFAEELVLEGNAGMIVRTAGQDASEAELREEYRALLESWEDISRRGSVTKAPALISDGDSLIGRAIRDMLDAETDVITDDSGLYEELTALARKAAPQMAGQISLHKGEIPLFDARGVDDAYEKALRRQVWLKSGGHLVVDFTEAMTVIDVNTGKFTGKNSLEDTILRINLEAAREVARQLRLRDVGGIIIVDFIDMREQSHRDELLQTLKDELKKDRNGAILEGLTTLGLVEITRKKKRLSAQKLLKHPCPVCGGEGVVDDYEAVAWRILYDLRRRQRITPDQAYVVRCPGGAIPALAGIGVPKGVKCHVVSSEEGAPYVIEAMEKQKLPEGAKLLPER